MCGRYTLHARLNLILQQFAIEAGLTEGRYEPPSWSPRYNIAPTQQVPIIRIDTASGKRILEERRWGLIPSWSKDPKIGARMINARGETVATKPSFRSAFKRRRCLVPADGYYEWQATDDGKQPFYITRDNDQPFAMAGLWESNHHCGDPFETFTIITTESNADTQSLHDRMPVILHPQHFDQWLDPDLDDGSQLQDLLRPLEGVRLKVTRVSRQVNNVRNQGEDLIVPA